MNIGKSKVVPEDDQAAVQADYEKSARLLAPYADYLVVNVSSPNTPGLRDLQAVDRLEPAARGAYAGGPTRSPTTRVPLLVKIAPDLSDDDVLAVADLATGLGPGRASSPPTPRSPARGCAPTRARSTRIGAGGLSGRPAHRALARRAAAAAGRVGDDLTLVAVGGITTVADARARLDAGATLLQGYTAFVYEGPLWPRRLVRGLRE